MKEIDCIYDMDGNQIKVGYTVVCIARDKGRGKLTTAKVVALHSKTVKLSFPEKEWKYEWTPDPVRPWDKSVGTYRELLVNVTGTVNHNAVYFCRGERDTYVEAIRRGNSKIGCRKCTMLKSPEILFCQECKDLLAEADAFLERLREQDKNGGAK